MALIIYEARHTTDVQFIEYWSRQYSYDLEPLYCNNIGNKLTKDRRWRTYAAFLGRPPRRPFGAPPRSLPPRSLRLRSGRPTGAVRQASLRANG